jgi:hypothetical protein
VVLADSTLIAEKARVPGVAACRYLPKSGFTGPLYVYAAGEKEYTYSILDIVQGAQPTVDEPAANPIAPLARIVLCPR